MFIIKNRIERRRKERLASAQQERFAARAIQRQFRTATAERGKQRRSVEVIERYYFRRLLRKCTRRFWRGRKLEALTRQELINVFRRIGLPPHGRKADLVQRMREWLADDPEFDVGRDDEDDSDGEGRQEGEGDAQRAQTPASATDTFIVEEQRRRAVEEGAARSAVYTCGRNDCGQLGLGDRRDRPMPALVQELAGQGVVELSVGADTDVTFARTDRGALWAWGGNVAGAFAAVGARRAVEDMNKFGQRVVHLGRVLEQADSPQPLRTFQEADPVLSVAAGRTHTLACTRSGDCFAWGSSGSGQLGVLPQHQRGRNRPREAHEFEPGQGEEEEEDNEEEEEEEEGKEGKEGKVEGTASSNNEPLAAPAQGDSLGDRDALLLRDFTPSQLAFAGAETKRCLLSGVRSELLPRALPALETADVVEIGAGAGFSIARTREGRLLWWGAAARWGTNQEFSRRAQDLVLRMGRETQPEGRRGGDSAAGSSPSLSRPVSRTGEVPPGNGLSRDLILFPEPVPGLGSVRISLVACGVVHAAMLTAAGVLYTVGNGDSGRLGHDSTAHALTPRRVEALAHRIVVDVSCGKWTTAAVAVPVGSVSTVDGRILGNEGSASDDEDAVGDREEEDEEEPEAQGSFLEAGRQRAKAKRAEENAAREAREQQRRAAGEEAALRDTAGVDIVAKLRASSRVGVIFGLPTFLYTWGTGLLGQLGIHGLQQSLRPRLCTKLCEDGVYPARVSCGVYHSALLTGDGEVFTWGSCAYGALGRPTSVSRQLGNQWIAHARSERAHAASARALLAGRRGKAPLVAGERRIRVTRRGMPHSTAVAVSSPGGAGSEEGKKEEKEEGEEEKEEGGVLATAGHGGAFDVSGGVVRSSPALPPLGTAVDEGREEELRFVSEPSIVEGLSGWGQGPAVAVACGRHFTAVALGQYVGPTKQAWRERERILNRKQTRRAMRMILRRISNLGLWKGWRQWQQVTEEQRAIAAARKELHARAQAVMMRDALYPPCRVCDGARKREDRRCTGFRPHPDSVWFCAACKHPRGEHKPYTSEEKRTWAAFIVLRAVRCHAVRKRVCRIGAHQWRRAEDEGSGRPYYYHPTHNWVTWRQPRFWDEEEYERVGEVHVLAAEVRRRVRRIRRARRELRAYGQRVEGERMWDEERRVVLLRACGEVLRCAAGVAWREAGQEEKAAKAARDKAKKDEKGPGKRAATAKAAEARQRAEQTKDIAVTLEERGCALTGAAPAFQRDEEGEGKAKKGKKKKKKKDKDKDQGKSPGKGKGKKGRGDEGAGAASPAPGDAGRDHSWLAEALEAASGALLERRGGQPQLHAWVPDDETLVAAARRTEEAAVPAAAAVPVAGEAVEGQGSSQGRGEEGRVTSSPEPPLLRTEAGWLDAAALGAVGVRLRGLVVPARAQLRGGDKEEEEEEEEEVGRKPSRRPWRACPPVPPSSWGPHAAWTQAVLVAAGTCLWRPGEWTSAVPAPSDAAAGDPSTLAKEACAALLRRARASGVDDAVPSPQCVEAALRLWPRLAAAAAAGVTGGNTAALWTRTPSRRGGSLLPARWLGVGLEGQGAEERGDERWMRAQRAVLACCESLAASRWAVPAHFPTAAAYANTVQAVYKAHTVRGTLRELVRRQYREVGLADGRVYWVHEPTGRTTWQRPPLWRRDDEGNSSVGRREGGE